MRRAFSRFACLGESRAAVPAFRLRSAALQLKRRAFDAVRVLNAVWKPVIELEPLETIDAAAVEQLLDRAFGTDRHARTAYRLRAGTQALNGLSLAAVDGDALVGSIQCWPVRHIGDDGASTPLVLVGPVAVDPARQQAGIGRMLMGASLIAAGAQGLDGAMMLVGDPDYYERFFGFTADATARWRLPGPVERHRLLARGALVPRGSGEIAPRVAVCA